MRTALSLLIPAALALLLAPGAPVGAAEGDKDRAARAAAKPAKPNKLPAFTPEREAAALTFVRLHHPELTALLERLKPMSPAEYEKAIGELFQASETLANLKARDERRYEVALDAWKARSRVELLAAQLARQPGPEVESQLRHALDRQVAVEIRQQQLERELAEARMHRAEEAADRLARDRSRMVEARLQALKKKVQRAERSARPTKTKGDAQ